MGNGLNKEDFVGRYLDGELSDIEKLEFENELVRNQDLREEYSFQKELINGIKEARRLELKNRLANVTINTPFFQTVAGKTVALVSITAAIGLGSYFLLQERDELGLSRIDVQVQNEMPADAELTIPAKPVVPDVDNNEVLEEREAQKEEVKSTIAATQKEEPKVAKKEPEVVRPEVVRPNVLSEIDEEEAIAANVPKEDKFNAVEDIKKSVESKVAIETIRDKKNSFHYRFHDNKLYLIGNFNDEPYKILELNSSAGKKYFLSYEGEYYQLNDQVMKPTPLIKIENDSLLNELKIIQDYK
jgi:hypothetical protein